MQVTCADCGRVDSLPCAVCDGSLAHVLCLGDAPVANRLRDSPDEPIERHPVHLVRCRKCATVQLASRPPAETLFGTDYPYRSGRNPGMVASAGALTGRLTAALSLGRGDLVLEVGSNDGYLLRHYLRRSVRVLGYDPALDAAEDAREQGVETIGQFFDAKAGRSIRGEAAVVHANNVIAHVDDPDDLMAGMAAAVSAEGLVVVETPWLAALIDAGAFDTIYLEHRFYWSAESLAVLFARHGLHVAHVEHIPEHGGSMRLFASKRPGWSLALTETVAAEHAHGLDGEAWPERFEVIHRGQVERLRQWWEATQPTAAYAASAKGAVLFHVIGHAPGWVVDSTPAKQQRWTPYGAVVLPPGELARRMPADCVVTSWNWSSTIKDRAKDYIEAGGRLWTLIPQPERLA